MMNLSNPLRLSVLAAALTFSPLIASVAGAQEAAPPATRPARGEGRQFNPAGGVERYEKALAELKLTDEQKPKVDAALAKARTEMAALQANPPAGEGRERFAPYMKVAADLREAVGAVLTEDQKKELAAKTTPPGRGGPGGAGGPGGGMARMMGELGLTDEQKTKVQAIMEEGQKKMQALRDENGDRQEMREKGRALRDEQQKAIEEVLTPEQKEKLTKLREAQPPRGPGGQGGERRRPQQQPL